MSLCTELIILQASACVQFHLANVQSAVCMLIYNKQHVSFNTLKKKNFISSILPYHVFYMLTWELMQHAVMKALHPLGSWSSAWNICRKPPFHAEKSRSSTKTSASLKVEKVAGITKVAL